MLNIERIRNILEEKKMSQKDLAEKAGITEAAVCRILSTNPKNQRTPQSHTLAKIARALNVSMDFIYE